MANKKGVDVSRFNGSINWQKAKAAGIDFVIPRDGAAYPGCKYGDQYALDPTFLANVQYALAAGIEIPGVYHWPDGDCAEDAVACAKQAIQNVDAAGLPKTTVIWCDLEFNDSQIAERKLTNATQKAMTEAFCDYILSQGRPTGVYTNQAYMAYVYGKDFGTKYDIWLADLEGEAAYPCVYRQTDWYGDVDGFSGKVDIDEYYGQYTAGTAKPTTAKAEEKEVKTMGKTEKFLTALATLGDGRYHYYDGKANGIGCSEYVRLALVSAGILKDGETFHAGSGNVGILADTSRFQRIAWSASALQAGDILWSNGHHVAVWAGDGSDSVYEAAPESTHSVATCGTGVGLHTGHGYYNCGTGGNTWTCLYRIIDGGTQASGETQTATSGLPKSKDYVKVALGVLDRKEGLNYQNSFPRNCGYCENDLSLTGDCWNINPKATTWSLYLNDLISGNYTPGKYYYKDGINASGLQDVTGDYILSNYCVETTFSQMISAQKAPCFLLINGAHMGAYIGEFERDGKTYNVSEFSPNAALNGTMRSYVDAYGQRWSYKGGTLLGSWNRCGYLTQFLDYTDWNDGAESVQEEKTIIETVVETAEGDQQTVSALDVAMQIYAGKWGNNPARKENITKTYGADMYDQAQEIVEKIVSAMNYYRIEIKVAGEILNREWGNNPDRQNDITAKYGANVYRIAQGYVNSICGEEYTLQQLQDAYTVAGRILCGVYGNGQARRDSIISEYSETVRALAQAMVNDILK